MRMHTSPARPGPTAGRDEEVQREIQNFLQALRTYPERFAQEPHLSFEQHFCRVAAELELPEISRKAASAG